MSVLRNRSLAVASCSLRVSTVVRCGNSWKTPGSVEYLELICSVSRHPNVNVRYQISSDSLFSCYCTRSLISVIELNLISNSGLGLGSQSCWHDCWHSCFSPVFLTCCCSCKLSKYSLSRPILGKKNEIKITRRNEWILALRCLNTWTFLHINILNQIGLQ